MLADAPRCCQILPDAPRCSHRLPDTPRYTQMLQDTPRCSQTNNQTNKETNKHTNKRQTTQRSAFETLVKDPETHVDHFNRTFWSKVGLVRCTPSPRLRPYRDDNVNYWLAVAHRHTPQHRRTPQRDLTSPQVFSLLILYKPNGVCNPGPTKIGTFRSRKNPEQSRTCKN